MRRAAPLVDLVGIVVFVLIGRAHHDHGDSVGGVISTTWPFALGLGVGWLLVRWRVGDGTRVVDGIVLSAVTVVVGMIARVLAGQGTAAAFVVVALGFLGLVFVGWRAVMGWLGGRSS